MTDRIRLDPASETPYLEKDIGGGQYAPAHVAFLQPYPYGALGHYRTTWRTVLLATQAAGSRLWTLRNSGTNLIIPTRIVLKWLQTAAHTAAIEDSLDIFKLTGFTADDSVNTAAQTASRLRTSMGAAPGNVSLKGLAAAGAAAGMTGGTLAADGQPLAQLPQWLLLAEPTGGPVPPAVLDDAPSMQGGHPVALAQNEGLAIQNRVLLGAAAGSSVYIDVTYAEVAAF